ncbi:steroid receptor RNA activator 1 [Pimephales promelas]|uniref:steroid receptor RNA activator 1 n=1 Tax=Pimephales promelas TaxID=90988 RepID=UPI0019555840|nr:steroid receptor RNA activator 1 [Pimephales promelas]XP_039519493.1 steroid receptor RNA activator 1 [Pimephales promelas]KAG1930871.1 steroid receptor RNA activator [Pimephales promelas]
MNDRFVKPGNQEHGWNDPPQFSYGLQKDPGGPKRNLLNKRVHAPQLTGSGSETLSTPVAGITPPRGINPPPPPLDSITPAPTCPRIPSEGSAELETEPRIEDVQESLYWALNACRHTVKKQICDDVERRLKLFEDMWKSGKLSPLVKRRMHGLSQAVKSRSWDAADEVHRGLMVDHVAEVSQWMVGVKRLIAEARSLDPQPLNNCTEDAQLTN